MDQRLFDRENVFPRIGVQFQSGELNPFALNELCVGDRADESNFFQMDVELFLDRTGQF